MCPHISHSYQPCEQSLHQAPILEKLTDNPRLIIPNAVLWRELDWMVRMYQVSQAQEHLLP